MADVRFTIRWTSRGYTVSRPNFHGGEVVDADVYDGVVRHRDGCVANLEAIRAAVEDAQAKFPTAILPREILSILNGNPTP